LDAVVRVHLHARRPRRREQRRRLGEFRQLQLDVPQEKLHTAEESLVRAVALGEQPVQLFLQLVFCFVEIGVLHRGS